MSETSPLDVPVRRADTGDAITLRQLVGGQPALVILTRHMDCPYCEVHVGRVLREQDELGRVIVVGHGTPDELAAHHADLPPEFVVVADPDQALYDAFHTRRLRRARDLRLKLSSVPTLLRHLVTGGRLVREGQDLLQLGGDAIVDPDGTVRWVHLSDQPDDRPSIEELRHHLHRAA
ncbi:MAG: uncharacterized protein JWM90_1904 [Thermoleophilia bacterium]|nr:uncharacterized protein [Thermoleophilia bacterium]